MGLFRRRNNQPVEDPLQRVRWQLAQLEQRLATEHAERQRVADRIAALEHRFEQRSLELRARLDEISTALANQLGELGGELDATAAHLAALDERDSGRGAQLAELEALHSARLQELEVFAGKIGTSDVATSVDLDVVRERQVAIANELVRYEIALRQDLAAAVERLGPRPRR
jgi:chromosome segregation ATPase